MTVTPVKPALYAAVFMSNHHARVRLHTPTNTHRLTFMNNHLFQLPLPSSSLYDPLINSVTGYIPVNHDWSGLANPVTPVLSL